MDASLKCANILNYMYKKITAVRITFAEAFKIAVTFKFCHAILKTNLQKLQSPYFF